MNSSLDLECPQICVLANVIQRLKVRNSVAKTVLYLLLFNIHLQRAYCHGGFGHSLASQPPSLFVPSDVAFSSVSDAGNKSRKCKLYMIVNVCFC